MTAETPRGKAWKVAAMLAFVALVIGLRVVALDSDAYPRLSWSSGLLTDEGFYIHNARNRVLFGQERTDDFNNALIMPTLHYVQVAVFTLFGVGAVQARLISVVCGVLTLAFLWSAMRRVFGTRAALFAVLFLGLDHIALLYNRMALMDTPAALAMTAAFWAFACGRREQKYSAGWLFACGALLGVAYMTRGVAAFLLPVPLAALWFAGRDKAERVEQRRAIIGMEAGLILALIVYAVWWWFPHRIELTQLNRYYVFDQLMPRSLNHLRHTFVIAFFGDSRGFSSYLFRHTPAVFAVTLAGLMVGARRRLWPETWGAHSRACALFLGLWLLSAWGVFAVIGYSPSRYYVLFYPAMAGVFGLTLANGKAVAAEVIRNRWIRALLGGFLFYHLAQVLFHRVFFLSNEKLAGVAVCVGAALFWGWRGRPSPPAPLPILGEGRGERIAATALALWFVVNLYWTGDWLTSLTYRQRDADRWLAENLPPNSVLLGDVAPGLSMNNRFVVVNVIPRLCNDNKPVERFASAPRYVTILDDRWREMWWVKNYPQIIQPENQVRRFPRLLRDFITIGVYRVPPSF